MKRRDESLSTLVTFGFFRSQHPILSSVLVVVMAISIFGMGIVAMIERGQTYLLPILLIFAGTWIYYFLSSNTKKHSQLKKVAPRVFLGVLMGLFLTGFVREETSLTSPLFIYPFVLLTFLTVPAREAAIWSTLGIAVIIGVNFVANDTSALGVDALPQIAFVFSVFAQFTITYLLNGSARATAQVAEERGRSLSESNARYETLFESMDDGLIVTNEIGVITFMNQAAETLLKQDLDSVYGQPVTGTMILMNHDDDTLPVAQHPFTRAIEENTSIKQDFTSELKHYILPKGGEKFIASYSASLVRNEGEIVGAIILFRDSTALDQMDRVKTEFVSLASHQLRTPLSVISWYTEKLASKKKGDLNEKQTGYVEEILNSSKRMSSLVNELLNVSRAELGRIKITGETVDVAALVNQLRDDIAIAAKDRNISFDVNIEEGQQTLENNDNNLVEAIIQNFFTNAVKYSSEGSNVSVRLTHHVAGDTLPNHANMSADGLMVAVADHGIGIPKDQHDRMFAKMFRADNVKATNVDGTGLGLYLSKKFAEALGGDIWFESVENEGTTFYVYLPYTR